MTEPTRTKDETPRGKEVRNTLFHLLLLVVVCFMVWQFAVMLKGPADAKPKLSRLDSAASIGHDTPAQPIDSALFRAAPSSATGMQRLKNKDPLDIAPPEGARRHWGFRRRIADTFEDSAGYSFTGGLSVAVEHYKASFKKKGFSLLGEQDADVNVKRLVFKRDSAGATVSLRKKAAEGKIIGISVLITHPAED